MSSYVRLILDTTSPQSLDLLLNGGSTYTGSRMVDAAISTADEDTTGYSMKLWGDIDFDWAKVNNLVEQDTPDQEVHADNAVWVDFASNKELRLSVTDGSKVIYVQLRDDVHNLSDIVEDSITVDTEVPNVLVLSGPTPPKISKVDGKNISELEFRFSKDVVEYKVTVVGNSGDAEQTAVVIADTNGSANVAGVGEFTEDTTIICEINGTDLEEASPGDGEKIVKVFAKDAMGRWSS